MRRALILHLATVLGLCSCDDAQAPSTETATTTSVQHTYDAGPSNGEPSAPSVPPAVCRASCEEGTGSDCEVREPLDTDLQTLAEIWGASDTCRARIVAAVMGECDDGTDFIFHSTGHTSEVRYFTESGAFIALATTSDDAERTCLGQTYWPSFVICQQPVVTEEASCGDYEVGDSVPLPWSDEVTAAREEIFDR